MNSRTRKLPHGQRRRMLAGALLLSAGALALPQLASAAPPYAISKVLVAEDQYQGERDLVPKPLFKPHDARTSALPQFWISSNERTGCAGITVFAEGSNAVLGKLIIDEPSVEYDATDAGAGGPCVGILAPPAPERPENAAPENHPAKLRMNPTVCLPVVLPPKAPVPVLKGVRARSGPLPNTICAPLGAEKHARHPHGIAIDSVRRIAYQVIEHSGLRWNADRSAFLVAETTDEESGMTLAYDISDPKRPKFVKAYLNGHGAHEVAVNPRNGLVFQGNHEDSPGVDPPIWVDVIDPAKANPYGFIDTGFFNAIQGIAVNGRVELDDIAGLGDGGEPTIVYGATHVGEKVFAFDGNCVPQPNPPGVVAPPAPPGYTLPEGVSAMKTGWNCILWWADVRPAFLAANPELSGALGTPADPALKPNVLHLHNLATDSAARRAYATIHNIHDAEHTGLSDEEPPEGTEETENVDFMGRWVVELGVPSYVDAASKKATAPVSIIDLSNGFGALGFPTVDDLLAQPDGLNKLMNSFVHAHFLWVDAARNTLLVTGEHTGNVAVVDTRSRRLEKVIPISRPIPGCVPPPPEEDPTAPPEAEEPHVHGVTVQPSTGRVYVTDEGEHCFYESVTIIDP